MGETRIITKITDTRYGYSVVNYASGQFTLTANAGFKILNTTYDGKIGYKFDVADTHTYLAGGLLTTVKRVEIVQKPANDNAWLEVRSCS